MRKSAIERKKTSLNVKMNGTAKSEQFSDVSEEGSLYHTEQKEESVDEELNWTYFHQTKLQIQNLVKDLIPIYKQYRNVLFQSIKEICLQGHITKYDYSKLAKEPEVQPQQPIKTQTVSIQEKINTVQKIISERRIKKYYKNKHEINFQDELDPEDDEREIYRLYQQAFFKKEEMNQKISKNHEKPAEIIYNNDAYLTVPQAINRIQPKIVQVQNKILDLSNQYNVDIDESFERMRYQNEGITNYGKKMVNIAKLNSPSVGFDHQLSFDVKNEQYFVNSNIKHQFDNSFGFIDLDKDEVNSQIRYDAQKMKKFNKNSKNNEKSSDQYSHTDQMFRNYIQKQHQQLNKQKQRVNQLAQKAEKVINNDLQFDEIPKDNNAQQDKIAQLRYLLGEMVQIYAVKECLKFNLKFKSFQLLNKLYENASQYYGEQIVFQQPLQVKYMSQIVQAAVPQQNQQGIQIVIHNIFNNAESISYQQFLEILTPTINDKQYDLIDSANYTATSFKSFDLTVRLFNIWIEIDYFEKQLKTLLEKNPDLMDKFIEQTKQNQMLMPQLIAQFISKSKKIPKSKKIKTEIFFRQILGPRLMISEFYRWIDTKPQKLNQKLAKQQQENKITYDYHLY